MWLFKNIFGKQETMRDLDLKFQVAQEESKEERDTINGLLDGIIPLLKASWISEKKLGMIIVLVTGKDTLQESLDMLSLISLFMLDNDIDTSKCESFAWYGEEAWGKAKNI